MRYELDYEEGTNTFDSETQELCLSRGCGLGSNWNVLVHLLLVLKLRGIVPQKISTNLVDLHGFNLYQDILYVDRHGVETWKSLSPAIFRNAAATLVPNYYGMGNTRDDIDFAILGPLFDAYFNLQEGVHRNAEAIIKKNQIVLDETVFVWWRKTDKVTEVNWFRSDARYPSIDDLVSHIPKNRPVIFQTDDVEIYFEMKQRSDVAFESLNILPLSYIPGRGFHHGEITASDPARFFRKYATSLEQHFIDLVSLIFVAAKCRFFVGYPGNVSMLVSFLKRGFANTVFFKSSDELF